MQSLSVKTPRSSQGAQFKNQLMGRFEAFLDELSSEQLAQLVAKRSSADLLAAVASLPKMPEQKLSPRVRNQIAFVEGKKTAFENIKKNYELLESGTVCKLLDISRQGLSKKVKSGQILAYTSGTKKFYPAFQFKGNKVIPEVAKLVKAIALDPAHEALVNVLLGFLAYKTNYSNPGEPDNLVPRYELLSDELGLQTVVRDFNNRTEMGR